MPPKPKGGVPMAEKRKRLLGIFAQLDEEGRPTMYSIKELENAGSKRGVASMQIKDIINDLVSDKLVDTEKIGSGNFYWALPSKAGQRMRQSLADVTNLVNREQSKLISLRLRNDVLKAERVTCKERTKKLEALSKLKQEENKLRASLQKMHDHDPTVLRGLKRAAESSFADCNRWADNLFQVRQYVESSMNVRPEMFDEVYQTKVKDFAAVDWASFEEGERKREKEEERRKQREMEKELEIEMERAEKEREKLELEIERKRDEKEIEEERE